MIKLIQVSIAILLSIYAPIALSHYMQKNSLSYSKSKLEILPLFKLKSNELITKKIIFIHPPKVGGTNIVNAIDAMEQIKSRRFPVPRVAGQSTILITEGWKGGMETLKDQCVGASNNCNIPQFISGHFPYGAHNYLNGQYTYITLIRSPLERELSSVNFDFQRGYIKNKKEALEQLLNIAIDNPQTRLLAGEAYMSGRCDEATLEIAKRNLETKFLLIGVTEDTNSFLQALATMLQLEPLAMSHTQVTDKKILRKLTPKMRMQLSKKHKYDQALYEYAKLWWDQWKKDNIVGVVPIKDSQEILTLLPEYLSTHKAIYMTTKEIQAHNKSSLNHLVEIQQKHLGVDIVK